MVGIRKSMISPAWILLGGVFLLLFGVWTIVKTIEHERALPPAAASRSDDTRSGIVATTGARQSFEAYQQFATRPPHAAHGRMSLEHDYTTEGIRTLAAALESFAADRRRLNGTRFEHLRELADRLAGNSSSLEHADIVRDAFISATELVAVVTGQDVSVLHDSARSINPERPLLEQEHQVYDFFRRAAAVLRAAETP